MIRSTKIISSFAAVLVIVGALGIASYINTQSLIKNNDWVIHTHEVMEGLGDILSFLKDAETGQRGFILTGENQYLDPYSQAADLIEDRIAKVTKLTEDDPIQQTALNQLQSLISSKLDELRQTIELRRRSGQEAAMPVILTHKGEKVMEDIRGLVAEMQQREQELLHSRQRASATSARWSTWTVAGGIPLSLIVLAIAAIVLMHGSRSGDLVAGPPAGDARWQKIVMRYAFAVLVAILASFLREWLLKLGPMPLFITYYPTVLLVAMVSGGGPGIVATSLSALAVTYYFVPPYRHWAVESPADAVALALFAGVSLSLCVVAERLRNSRWAEAFALAKQQEAEELARKNEELSQQAEELAQQSEELSQQNEELQSQSEEIQALNTELTGREDMLRKLLEAARLQSTEKSVLEEICLAAKDIFGSPVSAVVICERHENELSIRAQAGSRETPSPWPLEGAFPWMVMQEGRTACLNDASLRPDLKLLRLPNEEAFQSALSTPLHARGKLLGAVTVYSRQKHEWTTEQFSLIEWLATECGHILETLQLQDELRRTAEQNRLLSDLLERSDQPFGTGYPDGKLGYANAAFERLTGYSRKELENIDWANVLTPPQWRALEKAKLEELNRTGQPVRYEKEYIRKDGTCVPIELLVHLLKDDQGHPLHYYSFITDISERKHAEEVLQRSEARLRLAMDAAKAGIWEWDLRSNENAWSLETFRLYGLDPSQSNPSYETWRTAIHPQDRFNAEQTVRQASQQGIDLNLEWRVNLAGDSDRWLMSRGQPVRDESGKVVRYLGIVLDITNRKLAEEALAKAKNELEQRVVERTAELAQRAAQLRALAGELTISEQRERTRLAKILHDHLQQLLVAAKFRLAILGKGTEDLMQEAIREVEQLIDESIASSRSLTAELSPPILHEAGLNAGLEWLAKRMADRQGLLVELELEEIGQLPDDLKILLFESVREFLFNVAKHARTRSSIVNLRQVDGSLQVTVSDQGIGFDPAVMSKAGEEGKGFGLFSIRERLGLVGGKLEIQSAPGRGSRIILSVPMPQNSADQFPSTQAAALREVSKLEPAPSSAPDKKIRVLLVDDHTVVRQGIGSMLRNEQDIEIAGEAADGQEAVELARILKPDVILMDVSMPKLNGVEATRIIHADFPEIRIIGLSMFDEGEQAAAMLQAGAAKYVSKSGATAAIIGAIRNSVYPL
jgi:PAS domain S-box-containing protein